MVELRVEYLSKDASSTSPRVSVVVLSQLRTELDDINVRVYPLSCAIDPQPKGCLLEGDWATVNGCEGFAT